MEKEGNNSESLIKKAWLRALLFWIFSGIASNTMNLFALIVFVVFSGITFSHFMDPSFLLSDYGVLPMLIMYSAGMAGMLFFLFIFKRLIDREKISTIGISIKGYIYDLACGSIIGIVLISAGFFILYAFNYLDVAAIEFKPVDLSVSFILFIVVSFDRPTFFAIS